jgi:hypothetical protein
MGPRLREDAVSSRTKDVLTLLAENVAASPLSMF